ncbi:VOC family protein [Paenibacillus sp. N4]|uniref:VOC family protein n=1 Tax=Paenibacillus vietnamensis TaxID=2590547 RepID=UPI001CD16ECD|nr:VOC family protein [Paenibacillus vietnamensis]MCA0757656.1 VOC family protein [Paenibacillus vietnamensis]
MRGHFQLGQAALYARDRKRLQVFYQTMFEMKLLAADDRSDVSLLAFDPEAGSHDLSVVGHPNQVHMTFYTDSLASLQEHWRKVRKAGIPAAEMTVRDEGVSFRFSDPEGNRIEVMWRSG